jgi:hypothetical protein
MIQVSENEYETLVELVGFLKDIAPKNLDTAGEKEQRFSDDHKFTVQIPAHIFRKAKSCL